MPDPSTGTIYEAREYLRQQQALYGDELIIERTGPASLEELEAQVRQCNDCDISKNRNRIMFGCGNPNARLMLITGAPESAEKHNGTFFSGPSGELLVKILAAIEFTTDEIYYTHAMKCCETDEQSSKADAWSPCLNILRQQIQLIQPKILLILGLQPAQILLNRFEPLDKLRCLAHEFAGIPLMVTYHPSELIDNTTLKRLAWHDVQMLRRLYDERIGDKPRWQPKKK